jgi:hypothetical protein
MSLFDWYEPTDSNMQSCPLCSSKLAEWQGKDGPCGQFVWRQGARLPVDQKVDDEVRLVSPEFDNLVLPASFEIYSYSCPNHFPILAMGYCEDGIWKSSALKEYKR